MARTASPGFVAAAAIGALLLLRVAVLTVTPLGLGPDEAQYWRWAQSLDWGYYSKPPLIAWVVAGTTAVFGDSETAVRIAAPFAHAAGAAAVFAVGRSAYDARVGCFAALAYALMPGVSLSSGVMSTDGLLLPIWAGALYALQRLRTAPSWLAALALGALIGFGFLAKYAMAYFLIGAALAIAADPATRRALVSRQGAAAALAALAIVGPHAAWNMSNGFQTVAHTADNADWRAAAPELGNAWRFLVDQMGVFGPVAFLALAGLCGAALYRWRAAAPSDRVLLCFVLPPLLIILAQSVASRAHANWAATAYPAACVLLAAGLANDARAPRAWAAIGGVVFLAALFIPMTTFAGRLTIAASFAAVVAAFAVGFRARRIGLLWAAFAIHGLLAAGMAVMALAPPAWAETVGRAHDFKRARGWPETAAAVAAAARDQNATAVLVDEREIWHGLDYYGRNDRRIPVYAWRHDTAPKSFAEAEALAPPADRRVLVVSARPAHRDKLRGDFADYEEIGDLVVPIGGGLERRFKLFRASVYAPAPRDAAWAAAYTRGPALTE